MRSDTLSRRPAGRRGRASVGPRTEPHRFVPGEAMTTLLWMECGSCNGESMAILGTGAVSQDNPTLPDFLERNDVRLLGHPSFSAESSGGMARTIERIIAGEQELTLLCVEG